MKTKKEMIQYFSRDRFAAAQGITIEQVEESSATCSLVLCDTHKNALDGAQGGLVFTLADFTFAVAANARREGTVTLNASINYTGTASEGRLTAVATLQSESRRVSVYTVRVEDQAGRPVALASFTGYKRNMPIKP